MSSKDTLQRKKLLPVKQCIHETCRRLYRSSSTQEGRCPECRKIMICQHCTRPDIPDNFRRGLCNRCRQNSKILQAYDRYCGYSRDEAATVNPVTDEDEIDIVDRPDPPMPNNDRPGSPARVAALALRYKLGLQLWHPKDRDYRYNPELFGMLFRDERGHLDLEFVDIPGEELVIDPLGDLE